MSSASQVDRHSDLADIFSALGDSTRLGLVNSLLSGESRSVTQLSKGSSLSRQAVRKHLAVLQHAGLVTAKRVGRETRFDIDPDALDHAHRYLERASAQWEEALVRLRAFLEE